MANKYTNLNDLFVAIADAIRLKKNSTESIIADNFPMEIENLNNSSGFNYVNSKVTTISDYAFYNCKELNSVDCKNITSIGNNAFANCTNLTNITLPDGLTSIAFYAFRNCSGLTSVTIPDSVTSIGKCAFERCSSLTSVTIGNSVTSIDNFAFEGCSNLKSVYITDLAAWCNIRFYSTLSNPLYYADNLYINGVLATDIVIPSGVTSIGTHAFQGCSSLTSVTIPDSVTSIGFYAFRDCSNLTSITIGNSVTSIDNSALYDCSSLTSINYIGTIEQWNAIILKTDWNKMTGDYTIHCTDGDIAKDGTITYH